MYTYIYSYIDILILSIKGIHIFAYMFRLWVPSGRETGLWVCAGKKRGSLGAKSQQALGLSDPVVSV